MNIASAQYTAATQSIKAIQVHEPPELKPAGRTHLMTHGYRMERAAVLFHGFTSAPQQFRAFGQRLFALGYNVYLPRAPHHGLPDLLTTEHGQLTAAELKDAAHRAMDIAQGLGERVTVAGISMGGLMTAWVAQLRADIDQAMLIAPAFGFKAIPRWLTPAVREIALRLPDRFERWDSASKGKAGPAYAYERYSCHALAQLLRWSGEIQAVARRTAPHARSIIVVTNAGDASTDNAATAKVVAAWRATGAGQVHTFEFDRQQQLPHDLIDPDQTRQRVELVYQTLIELLRTHLPAKPK
jgi:esterase/lipase